MITINENELIELLRGIDTFVPNVGLTYSKVADMNKYLDFKVSGKANPNPYYDMIEGTFRMSNIQTGFDYFEQLGRKQKAEGVEVMTKENAKPIWYDLISKGLAKHKTKEEYYFRYQDHESSYLSTEYTFNNAPIEKVMFEQYLKETTDYSKYQNGIENELRVKVMSVKNIKRIAIFKEEYLIQR